MERAVKFQPTKPRKLDAVEHRVSVDCDADLKSLLDAIGVIVNKNSDPSQTDWSEMSASAVNIESAEIREGGTIHLELSHFRLKR